MDLTDRQRGDIREALGNSRDEPVNITLEGRQVQTRRVVQGLLQQVADLSYQRAVLQAQVELLEQKVDELTLDEEHEHG